MKQIMRPLLPLVTAAVAAAGQAPTGVPVDRSRDFGYELVVEGSPDEVLRLWSTEAGAESFLAPGVRIDGPVGGLYQISFDPEADPDGARHGTQGARLLRHVPGHEIAMEWTFPPLGRELHTKPYPTWVEVEVAPFAGNPQRTRLSFRHRGWPEGGKWDQARGFFRDGNWPLVLNRLVVRARDGHAAFDNALKTQAGQPETFDRFVFKSIEVAAPREAVWRAWTTEEGIRSFFAREARMDLHEGGTYEVLFDLDAPEGTRGSETCRVIAAQAPGLLAFEWNAPPAYPGVRPVHHVVDVQLDAVSPGRTRVRLYALGFGHGEEWEQVHAYFDDAWGRVLESLKEHFAG